MEKIPWFICLNDRKNIYNDLAKIAAKSSEVCENFDRYCLYAGEDQAFVDYLTGTGVTVIKHKSTFTDDINKTNRIPGEKLLMQGTYMRMDIPKVMHERGLDYSHYFYTDTDVIFQKDPYTELVDNLPSTIAATGEFTEQGNVKNLFNAGVMLCNTRYMYNSYEDLIQFVKLGKYNFQAHDQGALNIFYKDAVCKFSDLLNWKIYWGINKEAYLVHFHGLKIDRLEDFVTLDREKFLQKWPMIRHIVNYKPDTGEALNYYYNTYKQQLASL
jgi:hypothetical protein